MLSSSLFSLCSFFFYSQLPFKFNHHPFTTKTISNNDKAVLNHLCYIHGSRSTDKIILYFLVQLLCGNLSFVTLVNTALNYAHNNDELPQKEIEKDDANSSGISLSQGTTWCSC